MTGSRFTEEYLNAVSEKLQPAPRGEEPLRNANERPSLAQVTTLALARGTAALVRDIAECSHRRGLATSWPEAVRVRFADEVQAMIWISVTRFDEHDPEQYRIHWHLRNTRFIVNLRECFVPRALTVPDGVVMEIDAGVVDLPQYGTVIHFALGEKRMRAVQKEEAAAE